MSSTAASPPPTATKPPTAAPSNPAATTAAPASPPAGAAATPAQPKDVNRERAKASGDLDRVTDYVEEREMDASKVADSMRAMLGSTSTAAQRRAVMLADVKIVPADVDTIVAELDVDRRVAELALRDARGDLVAALCSLVH